MDMIAPENADDVFIDRRSLKVGGGICMGRRHHLFSYGRAKGFWCNRSESESWYEPSGNSTSRHTSLTHLGPTDYPHREHGSILPLLVRPPSETSTPAPSSH